MSLLFFKKLTNNARIPSKENQNSPGYKLFSAYDSVVRRNSKQLIFLDLCISIPENYYGIIVSNINEGINITLNVISKIIESNSEQNIGVLVANYGDKDFTINKGDCVGLLILSKIYKDIESFEIMDFLPDDEPINHSKPVKTILSEGHDVVDRLGCQDPKCNKCIK